MGRLLVSTSIEESWGDGEPILFLGEWCRDYRASDRWVGLDAEVLPYHWADRAKVEMDRERLWSLHEDLLVAISALLNARHRVDHEVRYWRILVGPWLGFFTQALFDRWSQVQMAVSSGAVDSTIVLEDLPDARVPVDMVDHLWLSNSHQWNHHVVARVLEATTDVPRRLASAGHLGGLKVDEELSHEGLRARLVDFALRILSPLARSSDVMVINPCLRSVREELALHLRLRQVPRLYRVGPVCGVDPDPAERGWRLKVADGDPFAECLGVLLAEFLPTAYLEGYRDLVAQSEEMSWPTSTSVVFTSASHLYDDLFKAWCAERVEAGAKLVIGQHGGHAGIGWSFFHHHQLSVADRFLSWGWDAPDDPRIRPVGTLKDPVLPERPEGRGMSAVLVLGNETAQVGSLSSSALSSEFLDYVDDIYSFVESLDPDVRSALRVRGSQHDVHWSVLERWADRFPDVDVDDGRRSILELLSEARIYVTTTNGTTFLESIYLGVPTVMFWDPDRWGILPESRPWFDRLTEVGVFHEDSISAAAHVNSIWNDVEAWWTGEDVVDAVASFSKRFCRRSPDTVGRVAMEIKAAGSR
ncbi:MAG: hypothetical protein CL466_08345 [Acidimicrobiaceae bacterium]|nr:hypothetical protein [Acidimicrobiaceae bacterium]